MARQDTDTSAGNWSATQGGYLTGQEAITTLDLVALEMERKWGAGRLRLLVGSELRAKFDRQRAKVDDAIRGTEVADVVRESGRMVAAWRALDREAENIDASRSNLAVWEVSLPDGRVAAIVQDSTVAGLVASQTQGRHVLVFTLEEIALLLANFPSLWSVKTEFPGATVEVVRKRPRDPLDALVP